MLEQMERALYAEDPKFASALDGSGLRTYTRRRVYLAVGGFLVVGVGLLMSGVIFKQPWVSVVGFLVMLGCALLAITGWRRLARPADQTPVRRQHHRRNVFGRRRHQPPRGTVMDRIEERWQRRRDQQGQ